MAVAHLAPEVRTALATAARAKQVVVLLVMARSTIPFKHGYGRALDRQDDGRICVVAEYMTSNAAVIPTEWNRGVVLIVDIKPFRIIPPSFVRVFGHVSEIDYSILVFNVWPWDIFGNPDRRHWDLSIIHSSCRPLDRDIGCFDGKWSVLTRCARHGNAIRSDVQPASPRTWLASTMMEYMSQGNSIRATGDRLTLFDLWCITGNYGRDLRE